MLKLTKTELLPIDKKLAKKFRDMRSLRNERDLKATRAKSHVDLISRNKFFTPLWGCCEHGGEVYRGNGHHTSHVLLACMQAHNGGLDAKSSEFVSEYLLPRGGKWSGDNAEDLPDVEEGEITACVEYFTADNDEDLVQFFKRYDSRESVRQASDVLGIYIGEQDDLKDLSKDRIRHALSGVLRVVKKEPEQLGLTKESEVVAIRGDQQGMSLRNPVIRAAVKWIVETVPHADLYKQTIGAQICAEIYVQHGPSKGERIVAELARQIENDEDPGASFEQALNKRRNKPTEESLLKKGRSAIKSIYQSLD